MLNLGAATTTGTGPPASIGVTPLSDVPPSNATGNVLAGLAEVGGEFTAATGAPSVDLTSLVQGWVDGDHPNAGVAVLALGENPGEGVSFPSPTASSGSPTMSVQYLSAVAPGAPTNLALRPGDGTVVAVWSAPTDEGSSAGVDHYALTVSSGATTVASQSVVGHFASVSGLSNATSYTVSVQAVNAVGAGTASQATTTPQAVSSKQSWIDCTLSYYQARDKLRTGIADTASSALATSSCASQLQGRLNQEATSQVALRQSISLNGHSPATGGTPQLDGVAVLPATDGGVDVWAHLADSLSNGVDGPAEVSQQQLLHFGADSNLAAVLNGDAALLPMSPADTPNAVLASTDQSIPAGFDSVAAASDGSNVTPAGPLAHGVAVPQYKHSISLTNAVIWARAHYKDHHYNSPSNCTAWLSRALHEGGGMAYNYHHQSSYSFLLIPGTFIPGVPNGHAINDDNAWFNGDSGPAIKNRWDGKNWTYSYNTAGNLLTFLSRNPGKYITAFDDARPGDLVFYAWTPTNGSHQTINHAGMVSYYTSSTSDQTFYTAQSDDDYSRRSIWDSIATIKAHDRYGHSPTIWIYRPAGSSK